MRWNFAVPISVVVLSAIGGCCRPGSEGRLAVELRPQQARLWCWAACAEMLTAYAGAEVKQCDQASREANRDRPATVTAIVCPCEQCAASEDDRILEESPLGGICVTPGWPDFEADGFAFERTYGGLSWSQLKKELSTNDHCGGSPVAFTHQPNADAAHMYVAFGFKELDGEGYIDVHDPAPSCNPDEGGLEPGETGGRTYLWDTYVWTHANYDRVEGQYEHTYDFYRVRKE